MKFFLLEQIGHVGWDCVRRMLVRAVNEDSARTIASQNHGDEGEHAWKDPAHTICVVVPIQGDPGLLIRDNKAG